jgi:F420 biosynthesis protein FbiB-like protein
MNHHDWAIETAVDNLNFLTRRRSVLRYLPDPVPDNVIREILTAAIWAPSAHNRQPWRFTVVGEAETKKRLATAMGARLRADLTADSVPPEVIDRDVGRSYDRLTNAPAFILLCLTMADMDSYSDEKRQHSENVMAIQSAAMAGQNLLLAAHARGLGACWMCAPLFCPALARTTLDLPPDWEPQGLITIGYPAETRQQTRQPLSSRLVYR